MMNEMMLGMMLVMEGMMLVMDIKPMVGMMRLWLGAGEAAFHKSIHLKT